MQATAPTTSADDVVPKLQRMLEISRELNSTADLDTLLTVILNAATELTASAAASVMLLNPHTHDLYFAAASQGSRPELIGMSVPLDNSIAGAILKTQQPVIVPDVSQDPRHHKQTGLAIDFETRSLLGVPMSAEGRTVGVIEAINKIEGEFGQTDVATLTTLASLAAIAIHRAGLIVQLQDANEQLSELDRLKSNFIAIASHELRTPLSIILGYVSLLRDDMGGSELGRVLGAAVRLRGLMDDMFNLQYIDTGRLQLNRSRFSLGEFIRAVVEERESLAQAKGHTVQVVLPPSACTLVADREALQLVLTNLIANAVKFTPAGGTITVSASQRPQEVWVSVSDNGIGIAKSHLGRIFNRFYQVEPHMTRQHGGLGLGLAIAKELVELHDGRIWAESQKGKGSTFTFALPLPDQV